MDEPDSLLETTHGHVVTLSINRQPNNHINRDLIVHIAERLEALDADANCRAVVLAGEGKHFCAGADFSKGDSGGLASPEGQPGRYLYVEAARLFRTRKPIIAAVQGAAIGAGLGLSVVADFRVTCAEARYAANFTRLGFHPGFGLSYTLPRLIGAQQAALLFYTGRRIDGVEAHRIGLADMLVSQAEVLTTAQSLAREIAVSSPAAVQGVRASMRRGMAEAFEAATEREFLQQSWQRQMEDFAEGRAAMAERREPRFQGR
ncbi:enoyl-CoA hydratase/isomerase family protein [Plastoroseomonas arctica]|uniref:Enoyl-CoA hydratase/isomerase family protein n=1 Tax=Plastoroseomonas arctica TaxID=1509237 RepID=A0AAF1KMF6_9PROT|nr:enoyl-CoA hydratase/isomerase family protein [Plastoroseomonas arctica]MBR0656321.1 enoyl-CoA hydratase/isomerase family protein [Plastoroseomonas arctica]